MSDDRHPGITMHKLPIGGGLIGLLFAVGSAAIFILGFPTLWYFVAFSAGLGILIALMIRIVHQRTANRSSPLSILATETPQHRSRVQRQKWQSLFQTLPKPSRPLHQLHITPFGRHARTV